MLRDFWRDFSGAMDGTKELTVKAGAEALDEDLGRAFLSRRRRPGATRALCPACGNGRLSLKLGRFGAFIGCSNYPELPLYARLRASRPRATAPPRAADTVLGNDPASGLPSR